MKHFLILGALFGLTGCVVPPNYQLAAAQQQCAYGDMNACAALNYMVPQGQYDQGNYDYTFGSLFLLDCCYGPGGVYRHGYHGYGWTSRQGWSGGRYVGNHGGGGNFVLRSNGGGGFHGGGSHR